MFTRRRRHLRATLVKDIAPGHGRPRPVQRAGAGLRCPPAGPRWWPGSPRAGPWIGTLIPAALLVALGVAYLLQGNHQAAPVTAGHLLPAWDGLASIVLAVNSFFTYAGVEVNAVHAGELRNPGREYPRSIFVATVLVLAAFIGPTLAIAWVIPARQIGFTAGVMQAFSSLLRHFGAAFGVPLPAIALAAGRSPGWWPGWTARPRGCCGSGASRVSSRPISRRASRCAFSPRRAP